MKCYPVLLLLCGSISWCQTVTPGSVPSVQASARESASAAVAAQQSGQQTGAGVAAPSDEPVITIVGLCVNPGGNLGDRNCKTVITQSQFEGVIAAIQPGMPQHARREFASDYADALVLAQMAEQWGLDRDENYEEQMRLARLDILSHALKKAVQEKASQIPEEEIESYYQTNRNRFERAEVDRIYIPWSRPSDSAVDTGFSHAEGQQSIGGLGERTRAEADALRASALSGAKFADLQVKAYRAAGIQNALPNTSMWIRSISLPSNQQLVMNLSPGEISPVLVDANGYSIFRMVRKELLPLDQVRDQIEETLRSQRIHDEINHILNSATTTLNETYFTK